MLSFKTLLKGYIIENFIFTQRILIELNFYELILKYCNTVFYCFDVFYRFNCNHLIFLKSDSYGK